MSSSLESCQLKTNRESYSLLRRVWIAGPNPVYLFCRDSSIPAENLSKVLTPIFQWTYDYSYLDYSRETTKDLTYDAHIQYRKHHQKSEAFPATPAQPLRHKHVCVPSNISERLDPILWNAWLSTDILDKTSRHRRDWIGRWMVWARIRNCAWLLHWLWSLRSDMFLSHFMDT